MQWLLLPVSTVSTRNARDHDFLLCTKYEEKNGLQMQMQSLAAMQVTGYTVSIFLFLFLNGWSYMYYSKLYYSDSVMYLIHRIAGEVLSPVKLMTSLKDKSEKGK